MLIDRGLLLDAACWYQVFSGIALSLDLEKEIDVEKLRYLSEELRKKIANASLVITPKTINDFIEFLDSHITVRDFANALYQVLKNRQKPPQLNKFCRLQVTRFPILKNLSVHNLRKF